MSKLFIKPIEKGLKVPKPEGGFLNAEGEQVQKSKYWLRCLKFGDVTKVEVKTKKQSKKNNKELLDDSII